ncbi:hypothetical protein AKJ16_DCAP12811 [Drosera capensis]
MALFLTERSQHAIAVAAINLISHNGTELLTFQIHTILWIENNARFVVAAIIFSALSTRPCSSTISPSSSSEFTAAGSARYFYA